MGGGRRPAEEGRRQESGSVVAVGNPSPDTSAEEPMTDSLPKRIGGPYLAPAVRPGDRVNCRRLGPCVVTGLSDAPVIGPVGRPEGRKNGRFAAWLRGP